MKTIFLFLFSLVFVSCSNSVEPNLVTTNIQGYVFDESTGAPIENADIAIYHTSSTDFDAHSYIVKSTKSDNQGYFNLSVDILKSEIYYLGASKPGYVKIDFRCYDRVRVKFLESQLIDVRLKKYN